MTQMDQMSLLKAVLIAGNKACNRHLSLCSISYRCWHFAAFVHYLLMSIWRRQLWLSCCVVVVLWLYCSFFSFNDCHFTGQVHAWATLLAFWPLSRCSLSQWWGVIIIGVDKKGEQCLMKYTRLTLPGSINKVWPWKHSFGLGSICLYPGNMCTVIWVVI